MPHPPGRKKKFLRGGDNGCYPVGTVPELRQTGAESPTHARTAFDHKQLFEVIFRQ